MIFGNELFGGLKLIDQPIFKDDRGYFTESFNQYKFLKEELIFSEKDLQHPNFL